MLRLLPIAALLFLAAPPVASAAVAQRDPSFGAGGEFRLAGQPIRAVARQADGKLVLAAEQRLVRLNANGTLDTTFATGGSVTPSGVDRLRALVIQADGKIVVGGAAGGRATLYRFDTHGSHDPGFGTNGRATLTTNSVAEQVNALALTSEGKLVAAGDSNGDAVVWRRRARDGAADVNFNAGGRVAVPFAAGTTETATGVAVQPNGRIVVVGSTSASADAFVARLHPVAGLDPAFATAGKLQLNLGGTETASAVTLQPDGKLVVAGRTSVGANGVVWRLLADGQPDDVFNDAGVQFLDLDADETLAAALTQPDGKLLLAGGTSAGGGDGAVHRLTTTGRPDTAFDGDGSATVDGGAAETLHAAVLQPDTNLIVAGTSGADGVVYRLLGDPVTVTVVSGGGLIRSVPGNLACTGVCSLALDPGTTLELTAFNLGRYLFTNWSAGPCASFGPVCTFPVTAPVTITANFLWLPLTGPAAAAEPADTSPPSITRARVVDRTVRFALSEPATTTATVKRGTRVVARVTGAKTALKLRKPLAAGRYRVTLVATDRAGNRSRPVTVSVRR